MFRSFIMGSEFFLKQVFHWPFDKALWVRFIYPMLQCSLNETNCENLRGYTFHIPMTKSATLNTLLHCNLWQFSGRASFLIFEGSFLHFGGEIARSPRVIFPLHTWNAFHSEIHMIDSFNYSGYFFIIVKWPFVCGVQRAHGLSTCYNLYTSTPWDFTISFSLLTSW